MNTLTSSIISHNRQKASDLGVMTFALMSNAESNKKTPTSSSLLLLKHLQILPRIQEQFT